MHSFRRFFALLFILSIFVTAAHELSHDKHDESCEICLLAHAPVLPGHSNIAVVIESCYEPFALSPLSVPLQSCVSFRNRSPPLA